MTAELGYWAAQEQHGPGELLHLLDLAENAGFRRAISSDHFHPWFHTDASSGSTLVWLASALERTRSMTIGTGVTAPIYRYHPAILAQDFATLGHLHPGRVAIGVGTGEAMNEIPLGFEWPPFRDRIERMEEAIQIMRLLWSEDFVDFEGRHYRLRGANLYVRPGTPIPINVAASGPKAAELAGRLADGLLTVPMDRSRYGEVLFPALERGAEAEGRVPSSLRRLLEFKFSFDLDYDRALDAIRRWGATEVPRIFDTQVYDPRELEGMAVEVEAEELLKTWEVVTDIEDLIGPLEEYGRLGFQEIYLHSSSPDEEGALKELGRRLLPTWEGEEDQ
ncbi:MAG: TIGR03557 family F420-dependent LLM class oxidoreductase [Thermoplasmata archaeon]